MPPICFNPPTPSPHFALSTNGTLHFRRIFSRRPPGIPPRTSASERQLLRFSARIRRFPPPDVVHSSPTGDRMSIFYRTISSFPVQTGRNCVRTQCCGRPHFRFFGYICGMSVPGSRLRYREPGKARRALFFSSDIFVIFVSNESPDDRMPRVAPAALFPSEGLVILYIGITRKNTEA